MHTFIVFNAYTIKSYTYTDIIRRITKSKVNIAPASIP